MILPSDLGFSNYLTSCGSSCRSSVKIFEKVRRVHWSEDTASWITILFGFGWSIKRLNSTRCSPASQFQLISVSWTVEVNHLKVLQYCLCFPDWCCWLSHDRFSSCWYRKLVQISKQQHGRISPALSIRRNKLFGIQVDSIFYLPRMNKLKGLAFPTLLRCQTCIWGLHEG